MIAATMVFRGVYRIFKVGFPSVNCTDMYTNLEDMNLYIITSRGAKHPEHVNHAQSRGSGGMLRKLRAQRVAFQPLN